MMTMLYAIDFFCGAGGLTRGLADSGIKVLLGVDVDNGCKETYERNNGVAYLCRDARKLPADYLKKILKGVSRKDLLFTGCAPCQSFSKQRKSTERRPDGTLLTRFAHFVSQIKPGHILIENVPGLMKVPGFSSYKRFLKTLKENGYQWEQKIMDAKSYGVPQTRKRLVLIASRYFKPSLPSYTHGKGRLPYATVRDAIASYPPVKAGGKHDSISNHYARSISHINMQRLALTPVDGGSRMSWPKKLRLNCHKTYEGHTDVYGRMFWDKAAPALTCRCTSISNGRYGHPEQNRAISFREAAALQTFPDEYEFFGESFQALSTQIGNAVPVKMARALGYHIKQLHEATCNGGQTHRKAT